MAETIRGTIHRVYYTSPTFSAGVIRTEDGHPIRFCGKFCANEGDLVAAEGHWKTDRDYGQQFEVQRLRYELPQTPEGLVQYLAKHPALVGIGQSTARKIVAHAPGPAELDRLLLEDPDELGRQLRIPRKTLELLREVWIAQGAENEVRSFLSGFGLTPKQIETLLENFGDGLLGVLRNDPYRIIQHVKGYGFKRVDKIARAMGTAKDHPGRLETGLLYVVQEETASGHTWIAGSDLVEKANELLLLDTLDSRDVIREAGKRLLCRGHLIATGSAITTPCFLDAERLIQQTFRRHAWAVRPLGDVHADVAGLRSRQAEAYRLALRHPVVVISGEAGTGKTHVLARLAKAFHAAGLKIALCSPTGKAAKRIEESLRQQGLDLEAKTIHRLLEYDGRQFNLPSLSQDVVVLDELSMADVPLMAELLQRLDFATTRLILVGDHNQLPPVGPGNVLRDIIQHRLAPTVILDEVVRQAGVLKTNCAAVLAGRVPPTAVSDPAWTVVDVFSEAQQIQVYLRDLVLEKIPRRLGLDPLDDVQIITPTHLGPLGTKAINRMMQRLLHGDVTAKFAVGDKVIQTANDYELGVMNGTIGRVVAIASGRNEGYQIDFDGTGQRQVSGEQVGNVRLAFAITAHRAQGSEFPCAVVLCHRSHFFADRNWLYTAVTRAAKHCILLGDRWGLGNVVKKNHTVRRRTLLSLWAVGNPARPITRRVNDEYGDGSYGVSRRRRA